MTDRETMVWPCLTYPDARAAITFLEEAFGFTATAVHGTGDTVAHAELRWPLGGGVKATVRAACVQRPEIVSGWDLAYDNGPGKKKGRPKPTRRLAPAGSVYFVELTGAKEDVARWCDTTWLAPVSDTDQERRDGFGLAFLGTWEETDHET